MPVQTSTFAKVYTNDSLRSAIEDLEAHESIYGNISDWDVSKVTDMKDLFKNATTFNEDISRWKVSSVTTMEGMFSGAMKFNGDISSWVVSSVTDMNNMFKSAATFNQNISSWDVAKVTNMASMFENAIRFNQDLSIWDVCAAQKNNADIFFYPSTYVFRGATAFLQNLHTHWPKECNDSPKDIAVLLETLHLSIFETNNKIINSYFDTDSREPIMNHFVYDGTKIDIPSIILNPPTLFVVDEMTVTTSGSTRIGAEYRFRKDTNASNILNSMFPNKIRTWS